MIKDLFPKGFLRYSTLPLLGSILDNFAVFIHKSGYPLRVVRRRLQATVAIDRAWKCPLQLVKVLVICLFNCFFPS